MNVYTLDWDINNLRHCGYRIIAQAQTAKGHVILWGNKGGYNVSTRKYSPECSDTGRIQTLEDAIINFEAEIRNILEGIQ